MLTWSPYVLVEKNVEYESYLHMAHKKTILRRQLVLSTMMYQCRWKQHSLMVIIILPGDFNAKLEFDVINNDMNSMSKNGEKLFDLFYKYNLTLLNTTDCCEGTHILIHVGTNPGWKNLFWIMFLYPQV